METSSRHQFMVLVMAGGRGTRFWPLSRNHRPKQCLALTGERTLLQQAVDRVVGLVGPDCVMVATGRDMEAEVRAQLPELPRENFLVEPRGRNTAPCIAWGAVETARRWGGDSVMAVLPADHVIADPETFRGVLAAAAEAASQTNSLVTIGIQPTRPETGYGYLEVGGELGRWGGRPFLRVRRFVEKPDAHTAAGFLATGGYLWNAGMFCWTVDAIRDAYREYLPRTWAAMEALAHRPEALDDLWERFDATSVDYGVLERSRGVLTVPAEFGWSDVGTWSALREVLPGVTGGSIIAGQSVALDARGNVVHAPGKLVALLGVDGLVVVDTEDVLLISRVDHAQEIRRIHDEVERRGLGKYL
ncbi:MAG: mannose-1-phosphate guanylyltransferase [Pseudomonadota bacterium]